MFFVVIFNFYSDGKGGYLCYFLGNWDLGRLNLERVYSFEGVGLVFGFGLSGFRLGLLYLVGWVFI